MAAAAIATIAGVILLHPPGSASGGARLPASGNEADCGPSPAPLVFIARAEAIDGTRVDFLVDEVLRAGDTEIPHVRDTATVDLGADASYLAVGEVYRVTVAGPRDTWSSSVRTDGELVLHGFRGDDCIGVGLTTFADGTRIETNWFVRHHVVGWSLATSLRWWPRSQSSRRPERCGGAGSNAACTTGSAADGRRLRTRPRRRP